MKIAFIAAANSIHTVRWANALSERGHDVSVYSCTAAYNAESYTVGVRLCPLKFPAPFGYYLNARQLKKAVKKGAFDIINVHYASGYGTLARRAGLRQALLNVWGSDVYEFPYKSGNNMRTIQKNLRYFARIASTSECMAKQTRKVLKDEGKEIDITPFGVDTSLFRPIEGLRDDNIFMFGTVKTLSPKYGISDSIAAFIQLYDRLRSEGRESEAEALQYEIYGDGELKEALQKQIDDAGMTKKIKICGYVAHKELPSIINRFRIFNSNSKNNSESFGVAAVEAMACGVPVIVSDADGFVEVVEEGVTGLISPKGDIASIAENMYRLYNDEQMRKRMGEAGVARVKRLYDWDDNVNTMIAIYEDMCRVDKQPSHRKS